MDDCARDAKRLEKDTVSNAGSWRLKGIALPVVGIGVLTQFVDRLVSHIVFAVVVAAFAVVTIITGIRTRPAP